MAETVFCHYRVRSDATAEFYELLRGHWPALHNLGLVTETPVRYWIGKENDGGVLIIEVFEWTADDAAVQAYHHPDIRPIWDRMEQLCESRNGQPGMEFPHLQPLEMDPTPNQMT